MLILKKFAKQAVSPLRQILSLHFKSHFTSHFNLAVALIASVCLFHSLGFANSPKMIEGEYIVKFRPTHGYMGRQKIASFKGKPGVGVRGKIDQLNLYSLKFSNKATQDEILQDLSQDSSVEYVEPNYVLYRIDLHPSSHQQSLGEESDLNSNTIYSVDGFNVTAPPSGADYRVPTRMVHAWSHLNTTADPVTVAVIDSGLATNHPKVVQSQALWVNPREQGRSAGVDNDGNGYAYDLNGWNFVDNNNNIQEGSTDSHGSHVAGIVLSATQDLFAAQMAEAKVRIMPLRFLNSSGSGSTSHAVQAIYYAVQNGARVINNSWGGTSYSKALLDALAYAYSQGVLIVSAAGNAGSNNDDSPIYPANYPIPSQITVGAHNVINIDGQFQENRAFFSNFGVNSVHIGAPGVSIHSLISNGSLATKMGTSMASPFVAGIAALVFREAPNLTGFQVRDIILNKASNLGQFNNVFQAARRLNAEAAVLEAIQQRNLGTVAYQAPFDATLYSQRGVASGEASSSSGGASGCGTVALNPFDSTKGPPNYPGILALTALFMLPFLTWALLFFQKQSDVQYRRKYPRFILNSDLSIKVGDKTFTGQLNTISEGGASFKSDALLTKGGVVTLLIQAPDSNEKIEATARVVWNEQNNRACGVAFESESAERIVDKVRRWGKKLPMAS